MIFIEGEGVLVSIGVTVACWSIGTKLGGNGVMIDGSL
jgi:hypothetical protein